MLVILRIAAQNLLAGGKRVLALALALAAATALLVLVTSQFASLNQRLIEAGTALQSGDVNVGGFVRRSPTRMTPVVLEASEVADKLRALTPEATSITRRQTWPVRLVSEANAWRAFAWGVELGSEPRLRSVLEENERPGAGNVRELASPRSLVLFASQAARLKVEVGDKVTVWARNAQGQNNALDLTVRAIVKDLGALTSWTVVLDFDTLTELLQLPHGSAAQLLVYLDDRRRAPEVMARLEHALAGPAAEVMPYRDLPSYSVLTEVETEDWRGQRLFVNTWREELHDFTWRLTANAGIAALLFIVLSMVIAIGVTNSILVAVRERTREIGTLRALGMSRLGIVMTFVTEGLLLGAVAAGTGGLVGALSARLLDGVSITIDSAAFRDIYFSDRIGFVVDPRQVLAVVLVFAAVTALAALAPALYAARERPADALRSSG